MSLKPLESWSLVRKTTAAVVVLTVAMASYHMVVWVWRDITYWSQSVTFTYRTDSLEQCVNRVALDRPGGVVSARGGTFALRVPGQEGAIVKPTGAAGEGHLVIFGHSRSVSTLGPASEESVQAALQELKAEFRKQCGSP